MSYHHFAAIMRFKRIVPICAVLAAGPVVSKETSPDNNLKLVNVQIFVRHGARTPIHCIASEAWANSVKWKPSIQQNLLPNKIDFKLLDTDTNEKVNPEDLLECPEFELYGGALPGQLTTTGQKEMYEFGCHLRDKYVKQLSFIKPDDMSEVYVRSSRMNRTINSAKCLLAGFYCSDDKEHISEGPFTIYSSHRATEILYPNVVLCPFLKAQKLKGIKINMKLPEVIATKNILRNILKVDSLKRTSGSAYENSLEATKDVECSLYHVRDEYVSRMHHGQAVPPEMKALLPLLNRQCCEEIICELLGSTSCKTEDLKFVVGPVISLILKNIQHVKFAHDQPNVQHDKCQIYVTHDTTLIPLLLSLGSFDGEWPNFAEHLIFELYRDKNENYWIKIIYADKPLILKQMGASESSPMIPLKLFENHMKSFIFENLENYCKRCRNKMTLHDFEAVQSTMLV